jgi:hypothetical protein
MLPTRQALVRRRRHAAAPPFAHLDPDTDVRARAERPHDSLPRTARHLGELELHA